MKDKNITLPVVIRESQRAGLDTLAGEHERSLSFFAREAFDDLLAKYGLLKKGADLSGDAQTGPEKVTGHSIAQDAAVVTNGVEA
jgi:hypothetical protein